MNTPSDKQPKPRKRRWKRRLLIFAGIVTALVVAVFIFLSPIAKYIIEKYDVEWTGREITISSAYVNPFSGYIYLSDPKIQELNSDSLALTAEGISVNFSMHELLQRTINIGDLTLHRPHWYVKQHGDKHDLNFKDLIQRFSSDGKTEKKKKKSLIRFVIQSLRVVDGTFYYNENMTPVDYSIRKVNITSSAIGYGADTIHFDYSFIDRYGKGAMNGTFMINVSNVDFRMDVNVVKYDMQLIEQYLKGLSNNGRFRANFDAKLNAKGNFKDAQNLKLTGLVRINDMHFGKDSVEDYASFSKLSVGIIELSPKGNLYVFDTVALQKPYLKYERYDHLDNLQYIFGKNGSKVSSVSGNAARFNLILEIADYVEKLAKNFFRSYYKINRAEIDDARFAYEDYTLNEKFAVATDPLYAEADSIDRMRKQVQMKLRMDIKPYGKVSLQLQVNPQDSSSFDLQYSLEKLPLAMFNPYLVKYTSYPLNRGSMEVSGTWKVREGKIQSMNHLVIVDPRIAYRVHNDEDKWIPLPLIMPLIRERSNAIDYEIPITGSLKKPKVHPRDAIMDFLRNMVFNPPTLPYRLDVKRTEEEIEMARTIHWETGQASLYRHQRKFVEKIADFLKDNPDAKITVSPREYADREKEYILFFEAKKKYYLAVNKMKASEFSERDSERVCRISIRDSFFLRHLDKCCDTRLIYTIQGKCTQYLSKGLVDKKYAELQKQRVASFKACFEESNTLKQLKIEPVKYKIPYNGFSYFKVNYKKEFPEELQEAYDRMNGFNSDEPRKKYNGKRRKVKFMR